MAREEVRGFSVTPAKLGFILSLIGVLTVGWKTVDYFKTQEFTLQTHADYIVEDKAQAKEVLGELKRLNETMNELVFIVKGTGARTQQTFAAPTIQ